MTIHSISKDAMAKNILWLQKKYETENFSYLSLVCPHHQQKDEGRMSALNRENDVGNKDDHDGNFYIRTELKNIFGSIKGRGTCGYE